jgi:hypothetical protein
VGRTTLSTALVIALLAGTAAAFAVTEHLKLEPSPFAVSKFTEVFSPVCGCPTDTAALPLRLRRSDRLSLHVVDESGDVVRTLATDEERPPGRVVFRWNGRDDTGRLVPEGVYHVRVRLAEADRKFSVPTPIRVDVTRPPVRLLSARPRVLLRRGDYRRRRLVVSYRLGERAHPELYVNGVRRVDGKRWRRGTSHLDWWGKIGGRHARPGRYRIAFVLTDAAGNRSVRRFTIRVR